MSDAATYFHAGAVKWRDPAATAKAVTSASASRCDGARRNLGRPAHVSVSTMTATLWRPIVGVLAAIAITTAMDANGLSVFSALPLLPLAAILWYLERFSRQEMGLVWGRWQHYALAALYPLVVLGAVTLVAAAAGAVDLSHANWGKALRNLALVAVTTILGVILTEEGFFRGWLWASLTRAGQTPERVLVWSSLAFSLWHLSAVSLKTGFDLPAAQIPVFMVNAAVIGAIWGLLRRISGSVIVASVSHGLWNGGDYVFFGFGTKVGALGIKDTAVFGPEVGVLGLALNIVFAALLWRWWKAQIAARAT
ncbi:MAG: CPBP family intramembrane metalloprotease [Acidobacteria bacterium]|nr:CPBP family intramembrane metalloprotease [Acidobacteriota bacterium]